MRPGWELLFVQNPDAALSLIEQNSFDAVVSDLGLPGEAGENILKETRHHSPNALRFILSETLDRTDILRAMEIAHQHFAKAEAIFQLKDALLRAFALQDLLKNKAVVELVAQVQSLPSIPALYKEILIELAKEAPAISEISSVISKDIGLCTKILQVVNSTFFGLPRNICSSEEAVAYLGIATIKSLVLSVQVFSLFGNLKIREYSVEELWNHSLLTAQAVRAIAEVESRPPEETNQAFTAGLLHDVGKLVLVSHFSKYRECWDARQTSQAPLWQIEQEKLGASHAEVGACLLATWGLPASIVEGVAFHHQPTRASDQLFSTVTAVHAANALVKQPGENGEVVLEPPLDWKYISKIHMQERLPVWQQTIAKLTGRAGTSFDLKNTGTRNQHRPIFI